MDNSCCSLRLVLLYFTILAFDNQCTKSITMDNCETLHTRPKPSIIAAYLDHDLATKYKIPNYNEAFLCR